MSDFDNILAALKAELEFAIKDFTSLEVDTIIADEIGGEMFNPGNAYVDIYFGMYRFPYSAAKDFPYSPALKYPLLLPKDQTSDQSKESLVTQAIADLQTHQEIDVYAETKAHLYQAYHNYGRLRKQLEDSYRKFIASCDESKSPRSAKSSILPAPFRLIGTNQTFELNTLLNSNKDHLWIEPQVQELLDNPSFLTALRKIYEIKSGFDRGEIIYAKTIIQLDGDVYTRFRKSLFFDSLGRIKKQDSQHQLIFEVHKESVSAATSQWHSLYGTLMSLLQKLSPGRAPK
ncbi:MAG: hypothetical protein AAGG02_21365 [Cyanobacteria bacterium P01_H01_bin.15]